MDYIQRIESELKLRGITAKKMLLELGYSDSLISTWKKGSEPSAVKLLKIAEYLQLSTDYILKGNILNYSPYQDLIRAYDKADEGTRKAVDKLLDID